MLLLLLLLQPDAIDNVRIKQDVTARPIAMVLGHHTIASQSSRIHTRTLIILHAKQQQFQWAGLSMIYSI